MPKKIDLFFKYLAERKYHENDLSDITYALCKSNISFRKFFLEFCFGKEVDTNNLIREYAYKGSRPDFFFHDLKQQQRLIEIKIYDQNPHNEYVKNFNDTELAFIANYDAKSLLKKPEKWKVYEWDTFIKELKDNSIIKDPIVAGYVQYLGIILRKKEFKQMNLKSIETFPDLIDSFDAIVSANLKNNEECNSNSFSKNYYGKIYKTTQKEKDLYFWLGIYFPQKDIRIGFFDHIAWVPQNILKTIKNYKNNSEYFEMERTQQDDDRDYGDFWFKMEMKNFNSSHNKKKQEELLTIFFREVFKSIKAENYLKKQ